MRPQALLLALALALPPAVSAHAATPPRPPEDVARDAARKPAEMMTFAGVKSGDKVGDLIPGEGYFTRVFSAAVGPNGKVYALQPAQAEAAHPEWSAAVKKIAATPGYENVRFVVMSAAAGAPEPLDVVWTSQNYHDVHNAMAPGGPPIDQVVAGFNRSVFAMLKPGGTLVVVDHVAEAGSGVRDTGTLHRIDPAVVKAEVTAAGFVFDGESRTLANPADTHAKMVFDPSIRGHTDQFAYRFKKPL